MVKAEYEQPYKVNVRIRTVYASMCDMSVRVCSARRTPRLAMVKAGVTIAGAVVEQLWF